MIKPYISWIAFISFMFVRYKDPHFFFTQNGITDLLNTFSKNYYCPSHGGACLQAHSSRSWCMSSRTIWATQLSPLSQREKKKKGMIASATIIKNKNCFENYSDYNFKSHKRRNQICRKMSLQWKLSETEILVKIRQYAKMQNYVLKAQTIILCFNSIASYIKNKLY